MHHSMLRASDIKEGRASRAAAARVMPGEGRIQKHEGPGSGSGPGGPGPGSCRQFPLQTCAQVLTWAPEAQRMSGEQFTLRHMVMEHFGSFACAPMATPAAAAITAINATSVNFFIPSLPGSSALFRNRSVNAAS